MMKVEIRRVQGRGCRCFELESDEKFQITTDTLTTKLDERIDELLVKYGRIPGRHGRACF